MIRGSRFLAFFLIGSLFFSFQLAFASEHGENVAKKTGILLVAFGSSMPEAQVSFEKIDQAVKKEFPNVEVRWAYTSHIIRNILNKQGKNVVSPIQALAAMADEGFTHVAVQSLHTIPGEEYSNLLEITERFNAMPDGMQHISVGRPLLFTSADVKAAVDVMLNILPKNRNKNEAVVLMGHGTHHPGDVYYSALQQTFDMKTNDIFVGTVEGHPTFEDVATQLKKGDYKKIYLMPFMSVAGDHARNDMAGDEPDAWKVMLEKMGYEVQPILHGTAEYSAIAALWVEHLRTALQELK